MNIKDLNDIYDIIVQITHLTDRLKIYNAPFEEGEHPRDAEGKFTEAGSGAGKVSGEPVTGYQASNPNDAIIFKGSPFKIDLNYRKATFKNFKSWYKDNLQGNYVSNPLLGRVLFSGVGLQEAWHQNVHTLENLKYISAVPEIIKSSREIIKEQVKHTKPGVKSVYRIKGYISDERSTRKVSIIILEDDKGNRFYTLDARQI